MGFLSVLGKIGKAVVPFIPGIGPVADKVLDGVMTGVDVAGQVAGGASRQRAEDRGAQGEYDLMRTQTQNRAQLEAAVARMAADKSRRGQMVGLDMMENYQPSTDPRAQKFSGGSQANRVNPETIKLMRDRTMQAFNTGSDVPPVMGMPEKPGGGATGMDSFLNALNLSSTAIGGMREAGLLGSGGNPGQRASVQAPADLEAQIFAQQQPPPDEDAPWWSPLRRGNGN